MLCYAMLCYAMLAGRRLPSLGRAGPPRSQASSRAPSRTWQALRSQGSPLSGSVARDGLPSGYPEARPARAEPAARLTPRASPRGLRRWGLRAWRQVPIWQDEGGPYGEGTDWMAGAGLGDDDDEYTRLLAEALSIA